MPSSLQGRGRPLRRRSRTAVAVVVVMLSMLASAPAQAEGGRAGDFNGDGRDDLAIGVPDEAVGAINDAGAVNVLPGSANGITAVNDLLFTQERLGGNSESIDRLGNALAYGDFDDDGYDDLAVGAPTEDHLGAIDAGVVHVVFGSANGLDGSNTQLLTQAGRLVGANEDGDFFGADLAAGDFNNDGHDDLAIAVPGEDGSSTIASGAVIVVYGNNAGLSTSGATFLSQAGPVPGSPEDFDAFGSSLAVGNFDGDSFDDIAIGVPGEAIGSLAGAGAFHVMYGSSSGIVVGGQIHAQKGPLPGASEAGDRFGTALVAGDFNNDGDDDLAVGTPGEDIGGDIDTGAVTIVYGSNSGLDAQDSDAFDQGGAVAGAREANDLFGASLAAGDFNNDGDDDLAVGLPGEDIGSKVDAGAIVVLGGSTTSGIRVTGSYGLTQGQLAGGATEAGDVFGTSLRVGDFDGDGHDDLAVSSPREDIGSIIDAGVVHVIYGSPGSLAPNSAMGFHQGTASVVGALEANDRLGSGL